MSVETVLYALRVLTDIVLCAIISKCDFLTVLTLSAPSIQIHYQLPYKRLTTGSVASNLLISETIVSAIKWVTVDLCCICSRAVALSSFSPVLFSGSFKTKQRLLLGKIEISTPKPEFYQKRFCSACHGVTPHTMVDMWWFSLQGAVTTWPTTIVNSLTK